MVFRSQKSEDSSRSVVRCAIFWLLASGFWLLPACSTNETNRAAPNLLAAVGHRRVAATMPFMSEELLAARVREEQAVNGYYDAIDSAGTDQVKFLAAKRALADAVAAVTKLMPAVPTPGATQPGAPSAATPVDSPAAGHPAPATARGAVPATEAATQGGNP